MMDWLKGGDSYTHVAVSGDFYEIYLTYSHQLKKLAVVLYRRNYLVVSTMCFEDKRFM